MAIGSLPPLKDTSCHWLLSPRIVSPQSVQFSSLCSSILLYLVRVMGMLGWHSDMDIGRSKDSNPTLRVPIGYAKSLSLTSSAGSATVAAMNGTSSCIPHISYHETEFDCHSRNIFFKGGGRSTLWSFLCSYNRILDKFWMWSECVVELWTLWESRLDLFDGVCVHLWIYFWCLAQSLFWSDQGLVTWVLFLLVRKSCQANIIKYHITYLFLSGKPELTMTTYGVLSLTRGLGNIIAGPISSSLISHQKHVQDIRTGFDVDRYSGLIWFTGIVTMATAALELILWIIQVKKKNIDSFGLFLFLACICYPDLLFGYLSKKKPRNGPLIVI